MPLSRVGTRKSCLDISQELDRIAEGGIAQEEVETFEMTLGEALKGGICERSDLVVIDGQIEWALKQYRLHSRIVPGYGAYTGNLSSEAYRYLLTQRQNPQSPYYRLHRALTNPLKEILSRPSTEIAGGAISCLLAILIHVRKKETWFIGCLAFFGVAGLVHGTNRLLSK